MSKTSPSSKQPTVQHNLQVVIRRVATYGVARRQTIKRVVRYAYPALAYLLLAVATFYIGWHANRVYANVQDATVYPYLFKHFKFHDIILPAQHPNILKFPLFWLQSILPYNFASLAIVNLGLLYTTVFGWCFLLAYMFGKRKLPLICILMSGVLLASVSLGMNLIETTIRNIEYPIGLAFILTISRILKNLPFTRKHILLACTASVLFGLASAGDSFMIYAFTAPIVLVICIDWLRTGVFTRRIAIALGVVAGVALAGAILRHLVSVLGIAEYYANGTFQTKIIPIDTFGPSVAHAISQLPDLFGGNIFGLPVSAHNSLYFINFILLLVGAGGIFSILRWAFSARTPSSADTRFINSRFSLAVIALSCLTTFGSYVFSGLAVNKLPNGTFVDAANTRYLTLIPFLLIACIVFLVGRHENTRKPFGYIIAGLVVITTLLSSTPIRAATIPSASFAATIHGNIESTIAIVKANHVDQIVAGDALAAPIRFWSHDTISFSSLIDCNKYMQLNTRLSWRQPSATPISSALVIDRVGADRAYLGACSDDQLRALYGAPAKVVVPHQYLSQPTLFEVWIYHYDIRTHIPSTG